MTCEYYVAYSANPSERTLCGKFAPFALKLAVPQRNNVAGEQRWHLCHEHYESADKVMVTG